VRLIAVLGASVAGAAAAAPPAAGVPVASAASGFMSVAFSLLLILGVIVALAWLATRLRLTPRAGSAGLRVLADVAVGAKERVVLLKVGDAQALVGVGTEGVRSLALLDRPVVLPPDSPPGAFAERLRTLMQPGAKR
jgi:flagellar protein FliO/FliZ